MIEFHLMIDKRLKKSFSQRTGFMSNEEMNLTNNVRNKRILRKIYENDKIFQF